MGRTGSVKKIQSRHESSADGSVGLLPQIAARWLKPNRTTVRLAFKTPLITARTSWNNGWRGPGFDNMTISLNLCSQQDQAEPINASFLKRPVAN